MADDGLLPRRLAFTGDVPASAIWTQVVLATVILWASGLRQQLTTTGTVIGFGFAGLPPGFAFGAGADFGRKRAFTTICGFAGLLFVAHKGLQTIGQLACLGVAATWLSTMLILPYLLRFVRKGVKNVAP